MIKKAEKPKEPDFKLELTPEQKEKVVKDMIKMQRKYNKGYRIIECPQCKHVSRGKWLVEVIQCSRCGYQKPKTI